ncbi:MAG TPA: ABC transporter ATP-binding protein [Rhizomicrobium sp.]
MSVEVLAAEAVHFSRQSRAVLAGATLSLSSREIVCLLGRNGAGKTTLLRIMLGFLHPERGIVRLDGRPLSGLSRRTLARRVAYVPQLHQPPFPYLVREVVGMGRMPSTGLFGQISRSDREAVDTVMESLGITPLAGRRYTQLSAGERQLVMIGRALAQGARLLVMDEPFTGLDYGHQMELMERLRGLKGEGYGMLMTTHQPDHAAIIATRVTTLEAGRIADDGMPEDIITPAVIRRLYGVEMHSFGCAQTIPK